MKTILLLGGIVFAGVMAWRIGERISPDAIAMALGLFFGVLATIPVALLVMVGQRTTHSHREPPPPPAFYYIDQRAPQREMLPPPSPCQAQNEIV